MKSLTTSFTLGKASISQTVNITHSNRELIATNVHADRIPQNVTYVKQNVREAYNELFSQSLAEYNAKQKRADRQIHDYYQHIADGKREEAFYEIVAQSLFLWDKGFRVYI